ncbi:putative hypothetical protein [Streptomyces sp. NBRC 110611]|nr:putative hypothetical protein [Streptomyces sp. NBRC 110611]
MPGARSAAAVVVDDPYGGEGALGGGPGPLTHASPAGPASAAGPASVVGPAVPPGFSGLASRTAEEVLAGYLHHHSAEFLRSLRSHRESGQDVAGAGEAACRMRRAARRISAALHTFRPLTDEVWAGQLIAELGWLSGTLAREQACVARRERLLAALQRLTGAAGRGERTEHSEHSEGPGPGSAVGSGPGPGPAPDSAPDPGAALSAGAARAGALLDRQLTLARTRAHSAALQALGSSRFHAVADSVAVLASEAPPARTAADQPAVKALPPLAEQAHRRLAEAVAALPLSRAGHPYNAEALTTDHRQDAPWHQVRLLVRLTRYAQELIAPDHADHPHLAEAARVLDLHRDAAEAAAAAAAAARTPRIAPATAYALGVLHADQRHQVEAARFTFGRLWLPRRA